MAHDDPDCTCPPGCPCGGEEFRPWDEQGSAITDFETGLTTTVQSTNGRYRIVSAEPDETGTFLTIVWQPVPDPTEGDPPA